MPTACSQISEAFLVPMLFAVSFAFQSWVQDITSNQLHKFLAGTTAVRPLVRVVVFGIWVQGSTPVLSVHIERPRRFYSEAQFSFFCVILSRLHPEGYPLAHFGSRVFVLENQLVGVNLLSVECESTPVTVSYTHLTLPTILLV